MEACMNYIYQNRLNRLKQYLQSKFGIHDELYHHPNEISMRCVKIVALHDNDRIEEIGNILHYLLSNIEQEPPQSTDLFLLSLYPDIYPKIEDWKELSICDGNDPAGKWLQAKQQEFLNKVSQSQSRIIYLVLKVFFKAKNNVIDPDFEMALIMYWYARSQGKEEFHV